MILILNTKKVLVIKGPILDIEYPDNDFYVDNADAAVDAVTTYLLGLDEDPPGVTCSFK